jgi:hypothetical protein
LAKNAPTFFPAYVVIPLYAWRLIM